MRACVCAYACVLENVFFFYKTHNLSSFTSKIINYKHNSQHGVDESINHSLLK